ncbi:MAG: hypothetical protein JWN44_29 [Myxococcales bacterium]|nr:hypothetical protein [Myxococcales bacterium]
MLTRSLFLASMFAMTLPACAGQTELASDDASLSDDDAKADRAGSTGSTGYFQMRRDFKRCAAPACGGSYVKRANFSDVKCHDGSSAAECYVADVDFSKLNLSADETSSLDQKQLLVKGTIAKQTINGKSYGKLVVTEAWAAAVTNSSTTTYAAIAGTVYRIKDNGVRCFTYPCASYKETKINGTTSRNVAGLDVSSTGATEDQISDVYTQTTMPDGLLVAGNNTPVSGPGGASVQLTATNFFTKVVHVEADPSTFCGGIAGIACAPGHFCDVTTPNACGAADLGGSCRILTELCIQSYVPVCGCDGKTYGNDCERGHAQVQLSHVGACN